MITYQAHCQIHLMENFHTIWIPGSGYYELQVHTSIRIIICSEIFYKIFSKISCLPLPKLWNKWARLLPENVSKNVMNKFIKTKFIQKYQDMSNVKTSDVLIVTPHHNVNCNLHDLILSSLLDVMLHIINQLVNIVNDHPAPTPISRASAGHTEENKNLFIIFIIYHYYSCRDCGKTATYCYTVPPIWHHSYICYYNYYMKCICTCFCI